MKTVLVSLILALAAAHSEGAVEQACAPGTWYVPAAERARPIAAREVVAGAARAQVVLLGEDHDDADHHLWQLQTLAALHSVRPLDAIGFEAFPRRVQPVLDAWIAGKLSSDEFLERSEWKKFWKLPPELYLPLFQFARLNAIPMLALNVDPPLKNAPISRPARAAPAYEARLFEAFKLHSKGKNSDRADPAFSSFVDAQLTWDRAMAQALTARLRAPAQPQPIVVGIIGSGHVRHGHGVAHQLRDLGIESVAALLPVSRAECAKLEAATADAVFVLPDRP